MSGVEVGNEYESHPGVNGESPQEVAECLQSAGGRPNRDDRKRRRRFDRGRQSGLPFWFPTFLLPFFGLLWHAPLKDLLSVRNAAGAA